MYTFDFLIYYILKRDYMDILDNRDIDIKYDMNDESNNLFDSLLLEFPNSISMISEKFIISFKFYLEMIMEREAFGARKFIEYEDAHEDNKKDLRIEVAMDLREKAENLAFVIEDINNLNNICKNEIINDILNIVSNTKIKADMIKEKRDNILAYIVNIESNLHLSSNLNSLEYKLSHRYLNRVDVSAIPDNYLDSIKKISDSMETLAMVRNNHQRMITKHYSKLFKSVHMILILIKI